jgi:hypothetical protein
MTRLLVSVWIAWLLVAGASPPAQAEEQSAQISIRVIYAIKDGPLSMDPALQDIQAELKDLPYTKFRLLDRLESPVQSGATVELQFPGNRSISVTFEGLDTSGEKSMLVLKLAVRPQLHMQLRVANGGRTLIGGPAHQDGTLILDVTAKLQAAAAQPKPPEKAPDAPQDKPLEVHDSKENVP